MPTLSPFIEQKVEKISRGYWVGTAENRDILHTIHTQYSERFEGETEWKITGGDVEVYLASEKKKRDEEAKSNSTVR